jgi:FkbM family methyltransferase
MFNRKENYKMFKWFLSRTLYHINGGSVLKTIQREWRTYKNRRRQNWWDSQSSKRISLIFNLQKNIRIYLHFDSKLSQLIYFNDFEKAERVFVNKVLKPGDTFVDVGANIGLFSLIAANCVGKKGRVVAFEPVEKIYQRFCDNIKLNDFLNVKSYNLAISDTTGEALFNQIEDGYDAWSTFGTPTDGRSFSSNVVKCDTWDKFAFENDFIGKVSLMKIDVEGWETHVLNGALKTLIREDAPVLLVEFSDIMAHLAGSSCKTLYNTIKKLGYEMFRYDEKLNKISKEPIREKYPDLNIIASKHPHKLLSRLDIESPF